MGQKANPLSLRLQNFRRTFDSCWYSDYFYSKCQSRDLNIKNYINTFYKLLKLPQARINVDFGLERIKIWTFFCHPKTFRVDLAKNLNIIQHLSKAWKIDAMKSFPSEFNHEVVKTKRNNRVPYHLLKKNPLTLYKEYNNLFLGSFISSQSEQERNLENSSRGPVLPLRGKKYERENVVVPFLPRKEDKKEMGLIKSNFVDSFYSSRNLGNQEYQVLLNRKLLLNQQNILKSTKFSFLMHPFQEQKPVTQNDKITDMSKKEFPNLKGPDLLVQSYAISKYQEENSTVRKQEILHELLTLYYYQNKCLINKNHENLIKTDLTNKNNNLLFNQFLKSQLIISAKDFKYRNYIENYLSSQLSSNSRDKEFDIQYLPFVSRHCWQSASFLADEIVYFLERRISFSRLRNRISRQASMQPFIRGIRITCSGRVGGKSKKAQRATQECIKYGSTGGHVFENRIDFASTSAHTPFGLLGIKVWICFK